MLAGSETSFTRFLKRRLAPARTIEGPGPWEDPGPVPVPFLRNCHGSFAGEVGRADLSRRGFDHLLPALLPAPSLPGGLDLVAPAVTGLCIRRHVGPVGADAGDILPVKRHGSELLGDAESDDRRVCRRHSDIAGGVGKLALLAIGGGLKGGVCGLL